MGDELRKYLITSKGVVRAGETPPQPSFLPSNYRKGIWSALARLLPNELRGNVGAAKEFFIRLAEIAPHTNSIESKRLIAIIERLAKGHAITPEYVAEAIKKPTLKKSKDNTERKKMKGFKEISRKLGYSRSSFPTPSNYNGSPIISTPIGGEPDKQR